LRRLPCFLHSGRSATPPIDVDGEDLSSGQNVFELLTVPSAKDSICTLHAIAHQFAFAGYSSRGTAINSYRIASFGRRGLDLLVRRVALGDCIDRECNGCLGHGFVLRFGDIKEVKHRATRPTTAMKRKASGKAQTADTIHRGIVLRGELLGNQANASMIMAIRGAVRQASRNFAACCAKNTFEAARSLL
jgi:hypothetical protein